MTKRNVQCDHFIFSDRQHKMCKCEGNYSNSDKCIHNGTLPALLRKSIIRASLLCNAAMTGY